MVADVRKLQGPPRVVHGSILCDPIQPNPSADLPNPTQLNPWVNPNHGQLWVHHCGSCWITQKCCGGAPVNRTVVHLHVFTHVTTPLATVTARSLVVVVVCVSCEFRPQRVHFRTSRTQLTTANLARAPA